MWQRGTSNERVRQNNGCCGEKGIDSEKTDCVLIGHRANIESAPAPARNRAASVRGDTTHQSAMYKLKRPSQRKSIEKARFL